MERGQLFDQFSHYILNSAVYAAESAKAQGAEFYVELDDLAADRVGAAVVTHGGMRFTVLHRLANKAWIGREEVPVERTVTVEMAPSRPLYLAGYRKGYFPLLSGNFSQLSRDEYFSEVSSGALFTDDSIQPGGMKHPYGFNLINFNHFHEQDLPLADMATQRSEVTYLVDDLPLMLGDFSEDTIEKDILTRFFDGLGEGTIDYLTKQDLPLLWRHRVDLPRTPIQQRALAKR